MIVYIVCLQEVEIDQTAIKRITRCCVMTMSKEQEKSSKLSCKFDLRGLATSLKPIIASPLYRTGLYQ
ncbi:hypothetical protein SUGI_0616510 [Cryptomeria japonica]|nr:hypothetical protein SUGI_0616510 [Cryptomeria japonica]